MRCGRRVSKTSRASGRGRSARHLGRHPRRRSCHRRRARQGRIVRLFRSAPRRADRHDASRALAGLDAETVHLWPRLRGRLHPSRNADRRPSNEVRRLCAGKFRSDVPGHRHRPQGAATSAQRAGRGGARSRRRQPPGCADPNDAGANFILPKGEAPGLAMGLGGVGISLHDLVTLYGGIIRLGTTVRCASRTTALP